MRRAPVAPPPDPEPTDPPPPEHDDGGDPGDDSITYLRFTHPVDATAFAVTSGNLPRIPAMLAAVRSETLYGSPGVALVARIWTAAGQTTVHVGEWMVADSAGGWYPMPGGYFTGPGVEVPAP